MIGIYLLKKIVHARDIGNERKRHLVDKEPRKKRRMFPYLSHILAEPRMAFVGRLEFARHRIAQPVDFVHHAGNHHEPGGMITVHFVFGDGIVGHEKVERSLPVFRNGVFIQSARKAAQRVKRLPVQYRAPFSVECDAAAERLLRVRYAARLFGHNLAAGAFADANRNILGSVRKFGGIACHFRKSGCENIRISADCLAVCAPKDKFRLESLQRKLDRVQLERCYKADRTVFRRKRIADCGTRKIGDRFRTL